MQANLKTEHTLETVPLDDPEALAGVLVHLVRAGEYEPTALRVAAKVVDDLRPVLAAAADVLGPDTPAGWR